MGDVCCWILVILFFVFCIFCYFKGENCSNNKRYNRNHDTERKEDMYDEDL